MKVQARYFGGLREIAGATEETFSLPEGATIGSLIEKVCSGRQAAEKLVAAASFALGGKYCGREAALSDGETVTIIPPVAGG